MRNQWAAVYIGGCLFFAILARGCGGGVAVAGGASHSDGGDSDTASYSRLGEVVQAGRAYR